MTERLYQRVSSLCDDNQDLLEGLLNAYDRFSHGAVTRETRHILQEVLTPERQSFILGLDFSMPENVLLLTQRESPYSTLFSELMKKLDEFYSNAADLISTCNGDGTLRIVQRNEVYDRCRRVKKKFENLYACHQEYSFLRMLHNVLRYEQDLVTKHSGQHPVISNLLKRRHSTSANLQPGLKLRRLCDEQLQQPGLQRFKQLLENSVLIISQDKALSALRNMRLIADEVLTTSTVASVINGPVVQEELESLCSQQRLGQVRDACHSFGLDENFLAVANALLLKSLIIMEQDVQVVRQGKYVSLKVRLLFADFFLQFYAKEAIDLKVALLDSQQYANCAKGNFSLAELREQSKIFISHTELKAKKNDLRISSPKTVTLCFRFKTLPNRKQPVWARIFAFCVFAEADWLPEAAAMRVLSLPVTLISNDNQRYESEACIRYESLFPGQLDISDNSLPKVEIGNLISLIESYFQRETSQQLNPDSIDFFQEKCRLLSSGDGLVKFEDFVKSVQSCGKRTLWEFVCACIKFIKDHAVEMHDARLIYGFVSKERTTDILRGMARESRPDNSFALLRFSESAATVTVSINNEHIQPPEEGDFKKKLLADFALNICTRPSNTLSHTFLIDCRNEAIPATKLEEFIPKEKLMPGYVSLRTGQSLAEECDRLSRSSITSPSLSLPEEDEISNEFLDDFLSNDDDNCQAFPT